MAIRANTGIERACSRHQIRIQWRSVQLIRRAKGLDEIRAIENRAEIEAGAGDHAGSDRMSR